MDEIDQLLATVKQSAHGLMPVPVYRRIYESAARCGGGTIVEIGTYRGAATVALALGARSAGLPFCVLTADLLRPGVGAKGETIGQKTEELRSTFARFGVEDAIRFIHGGSAELDAAADPRGIKLLLLDGGGRIETDLALFWDRLEPDCAIVIDDVDGAVHAERSLRAAIIDQKHRISKLLADRFVEAGLLVPEDMILSTGWYRKGRPRVAAGEIETLALPAYHALIKVPLALAEIDAVRAILRRLARRAPGLARVWRRIRPARPRA